jgi:minor histocompatibility antigen H13
MEIDAPAPPAPATSASAAPPPRLRPLHPASLSLLGLLAVEGLLHHGVAVPGAAQMFLLTTFIIVIGSTWSLYGAAGVGEREKAMTSSDAAQLPFFAGAMLLGLYALFKYADARLVNLALRVYFVGSGAFAVATACAPVLAGALGCDGRALFHVPAAPPLWRARVPVTRSALVGLVLGAGAAGWWGATSHWLANNALGACYCVAALALMNVGSVRTGTILLCGLFVYDIFMVFGTGWLLGPTRASIMEEVAVRVEGPIKLLFPLPEAEARGRRPEGMLGLGDVIVPGVFLAMLLRFDVARAAKRDGAAVASAAAAHDAPAPTFYAALFAYALGLVATNVSMHVMDAAQPALLYLVPFVLAGAGAAAAANGVLEELWEYSEEEEDPAAAGRTWAQWLLGELLPKGLADALMGKATAEQVAGADVLAAAAAAAAAVAAAPATTEEKPAGGAADKRLAAGAAGSGLAPS